MRGIYQHCSEKHLHRYLAEFDFRYNYRESLGFDDTAAVRGGEGRRLTYHQPHLAKFQISGCAVFALATLARRLIFTCYAAPAKPGWNIL
jgi:hypothetical protein